LRGIFNGSLTWARSEIEREREREAEMTEKVQKMEKKNDVMDGEV
jgi:hypothetical protein